MVMIAATTGLRESELFALKGGDFDFERGLLAIQRRLYRGKRGETKTAKRQAVEELGRLIFPKLSPFATAIAIGSVN
jgi:integrase